jgi:hypothetical protein
MELVAIGLPLIGGAIWLKHRPRRADLWNWIAAWAAVNRDAAITRKERRREYLSAEVAR